LKTEILFSRKQEIFTEIEAALTLFSKMGNILPEMLVAFFGIFLDAQNI